MIILFVLNLEKVIEFFNDELEKLQEQIANEYGYKLVDHRLELWCSS